MWKNESFCLRVESVYYVIMSSGGESDGKKLVSEEPIIQADEPLQVSKDDDRGDFDKFFDGLKIPTHEELWASAKDIYEEIERDGDELDKEKIDTKNNSLKNQPLIEQLETKKERDNLKKISEIYKIPINDITENFVDAALRRAEIKYFSPFENPVVVATQRVREDSKRIKEWNRNNPPH